MSCCVLSEALLKYNSYIFSMSALVSAGFVLHHPGETTALVIILHEMCGKISTIKLVQFI